MSVNIIIIFEMSFRSAPEKWIAIFMNQGREIAQIHVLAEYKKRSMINAWMKASNIQSLMAYFL